MPSRRAAAIILGAAVFTGATAGAGAAVVNVDLPPFLVASPGASTPPVEPPQQTPSLRATPSASFSPSVSPKPVAQKRTVSPQPGKPEEPSPGPSEEETPEPDPEPTKPTEFVSVSFGTPGTPGGAGGATNDVDVPKGWKIVDKGGQWRDFNDPTGNLNLRVRSERLGTDNDDAAAKSLAEREFEPGYTRLGRESITYRDGNGETKTGTEVRYAWTASKGTRYAVERYLENENVLVAGYGWEGQLALVEPAVQRATTTYVGGGD